MNSIRAIIFDCDGTLADTMPSHYEAWMAVLDRYRLEMSEDRFYALGGWPTRRVAELLIGESGREIDAEQLSHEKESLFTEMLHLVRPIEPVVEVVRRERGRLPLAVATGAVRPICERILHQIGVRDHFDTIVSSEDVTRHKPSPDIFLEAARRLGVEPKYCRVYEDTDPGVEAARQAGMHFVDVRDLYTPRRGDVKKRAETFPRRPRPMFDFAAKFSAGLSYADFLKTHGSDEHRRRWAELHGRVKLTADQQKLVASFQREMKVLCLAGAWCGDCVNQCPIFDHFAAVNDRIVVRYFDRDTHPDLAGELKVCGGARVPVVVFLSEDGFEVGRYGDRTLSKYRKLAADQLGPACPTGLVPPEQNLLDAVTQDWLDEFERAQLILRTSARLRQKHGD